MPLSWNEIRQRAISFSKEFEKERKENAESKSFWDGFFNVFGISRHRVATFEEPVKKLGDKRGFIDLFWKGNLIVEHKSKGKNLDKAFEQAIDYFPNLREEELPKFILVSDFARFRLYNLEENTQNEFLLSELHDNIKLFGFIAGYQKVVFNETHPINLEAAEKIGKIHDCLKKNGYTGHELEVYLVRIVFLMFADKTGIFEKGIFWELIENHTAKDGNDLGCKIAQLFQILNTQTEKRFKNLDESFTVFPYIDGNLFAEILPIASFDSEMRQIILENCGLDWGLISPAIFGSLFQSIMDKDARRNLGAHYTSEKNILKLIKPLFLDELWNEFEKVKENSKKLLDFHKKLSKLTFLDPACGSGNFLIIAYRELRLLELEILKILHKNEQVLDIENIIRLDIDQFFGIEIDEWAAQIAKVAMWLIDHQMNIKISETFGKYFARIPLKKSANIFLDNSLRIPWENIISPHQLSYILGNPPFVAKDKQTKEQKNDLKPITNSINGGGVLDYVTGWFIKAAKFIQNTNVKVAFVSTNSIVQGEQVGVLWNELLNQYKIKIHFAHKTFKWSNEAKNNAEVCIIIIGFANFDTKEKYIFDYQDTEGEPAISKVENINPYLMAGKDIVVVKRTKPICNVPEMQFGNMPNEGGNYIFDEQQLQEFLQKDLDAEKFMRPFLGSDEFIYSVKKYCLWLKNISPAELRKHREILKRVEKVKEIRLKSQRETTRNLANFPTLFGEIRQPDSDFLLIPRTTSEKRKYIPIGYISKNVIVASSCVFIADASLFIFGILTSKMHDVWTRQTCGRLGNGLRYSIQIVYNNFPFPKEISEKQKEKVEQAAQKILDIRKTFSENSLADLYDSLSMPTKLMKAHQELDKQVDLSYRSQPFNDENSRIEFLFALYTEYVAPLQAEIDKEIKKLKRKKKN